MTDDQQPTHPPVEGPETPLEETRHPEEAAQHEAEALASELEELRKEREELAKQVEEAAAREAELKDRLLRLGADFENYRRRAREDSAAASARGKESFLKALLPVLDNLDRALAHTEDEGLRLLARQLHETLHQEGVAVVSPEGEAFDAKLHEAIAQQEQEGVESGHVVAVAEKGYTLDGRVLRPARVIVAP